MHGSASGGTQHQVTSVICSYRHLCIGLQTACSARAKMNYFRIVQGRKAPSRKKGIKLCDEKKLTLVFSELNLFMPRCKGSVHVQPISETVACKSN